MHTKFKIYKGTLLLILIIFFVLITTQVCPVKEGIQNASTITISLKDMSGRIVTFKKNPKKIVSIDRGFIPQVLSVLGEENRLVATGGIYPRSGPYNTNKSDNMFLVPHVLSIPNIGWAGYGAYDFEKLVEVMPDLVIIRQYSNLQENSHQMGMIDRIQNDFHIPIFILYDLSIYDNPNPEKYIESIKLIGEIIEKAVEAEDLSNYINGQFIKISKMAEKYNSQEKMLIIGVTDSITGTGQVYGTDYANAVFSTSIAGIKNVFQEYASPILTPEEIVEMNPDCVVLVDSSGTENVEDFRKISNFRSIKAIINNRIRTTGQLSWWGDTKLLLPIQLMIYADTYYQDNKIDLYDYCSEYLNRLFDLSHEDINKILNIVGIEWIIQ